MKILNKKVSHIPTLHGDKVDRKFSYLLYGNMKYFFYSQIERAEKISFPAQN